MTFSLVELETSKQVPIYHDADHKIIRKYCVFYTVDFVLKIVVFMPIKLKQFYKV